MSEGQSSISTSCRSAVDETLVHFFPSMQGMYEDTSIFNVYVAYIDEKPMITGSPVTNPGGNNFMFQVLWKGKPDFCRPNISLAVPPYISPLILHVQVKKKAHP